MWQQIAHRETTDYETEPQSHVNSNDKEKQDEKDESRTIVWRATGGGGVVVCGCNVMLPSFFLGKHRHNTPVFYNRKSPHPCGEAYKCYYGYQIIFHKPIHTIKQTAHNHLTTYYHVTKIPNLAHLMTLRKFYSLTVMRYG